MNHNAVHEQCSCSSRELNALNSSQTEFHPDDSLANEFRPDEFGPNEFLANEFHQKFVQMNFVSKIISEVCREVFYSSIIRKVCIVGAECRCELSLICRIAPTNWPTDLNLIRDARREVRKFNRFFGLGVLTK